MDPALYVYPPSDRAWVRSNFVATIDGAVTDGDGVSGSLGGDADHRAFTIMRSLADVVLVGAGTARDEDYGLAEKYGSDRIRTTAHQKLVLLDIREEDVESAVADLDAIGLQARPSRWRQHTMACTGIEYCKLAIVNTKDRARDLIDELEQRVPELDTPITVNVNGCPNSCARIQTADIGLKGQLVLDENGEQVEGFQVHLGGALGLEAGFGRKLRAHKVTGTELPDYVEKLSRTYLEQREDGESFARWAARADEEALR